MQARRWLATAELRGRAARVGHDRCGAYTGGVGPVHHVGARRIEEWTWPSGELELLSRPWNMIFPEAFMRGESTDTTLGCGGGGALLGYGQAGQERWPLNSSVSL